MALLLCFPLVWKGPLPQAHGWGLMAFQSCLYFQKPKGFWGQIPHGRENGALLKAPAIVRRENFRKTLVVRGESQTKTEMQRRVLEGRAMGNRVVERRSTVIFKKPSHFLYCFLLLLKSRKGSRAGECPQDTRSMSIMKSGNFT